MTTTNKQLLLHAVSPFLRATTGPSRRCNPQLGNVVFDWMEPARVVKVDVLQDKARQLGRHRRHLEQCARR
jgi:hypothetical protein